MGDVVTPPNTAELQLRRCPSRWGPAIGAGHVCACGGKARHAMPDHWCECGATWRDGEANLTPQDRKALRMLLAAERSCGGPESGYACATPDGTWMEGGERWRQAWVNWQTVSRLIDLDLVDADSYDGKWDDVYLTERGRALAELLTEREGAA